VEKQEEHLIKRVSKELGLTYKELGEKIGYTESALKKSVSENRLPSQLKKSIELYLEVLELKRKEEETKQFKKILRTFIAN